MRNFILTMAALTLSAVLTAQGVFSNRTQSVLEKVIQDYPNHFYNIKGEPIGQAEQVSEYRSTLQLPGASSCIIRLSAANRPEGDRWTCTLSKLDDFRQAKARYADIYQELSNCIIRNSARKTFILSGQYEEPEPDRKQTYITLTLLPAVGDLKRVRVGLLLSQEGSGWKIALSVNDQQSRDGAQVAMADK